MDLAVTEMWRDALGRFDRLTETGVDMVVRHLEIDFRRPARFDDMLRLEARIERLGTTSMTTRVGILRADGELLTEARVRHVFLAMESWKKTRIPGWVREGLSTLAPEKVSGGRELS